MVWKAFDDPFHWVGIYSDEHNSVNDERMCANQWHCAC